MTDTPSRPGQALLLVDLQRWIVELDLAPRSGQAVLHRCVALRDAFEKAQAPVIFVRYLRPGRRTDPGDEWVPELVPAAHNPVVTKNGQDAFAATGLHDILGTLDVQHLTVAGIATANGILTTATTALHLGYATAVVEDATSSLDETGHRSALQILRASGADVITAGAPSS